MDGKLPGIEDIAFYTRRTTDWWWEVGKELRDIEFLMNDGEELVIRKFSERQAPVPATERSRQHRIVQHNCNDNATLSHGETEEETETEKEEKQTESTATAKIFKAYETEIGCLTPMISNRIEDDLDTLKIPEEWFMDAIHEAAVNNKRNWGYCRAILKRWSVEGKVTGKKPASRNNFRQAQIDKLRSM
jgi:DnaD/phage-associated family protein